jgi:epoxyqueuosine reductase QueG
MKTLIFKKLNTYVDHAQRRYVAVLFDTLDFTKRPIELKINPSDLTYERLVSILIELNYPNDKMQAIINNYLLDSTDENVINEFSEMQNYRKLCKEVAKQILASC